MIKSTKISELTPDGRNANMGTEYGAHLLEKSLRDLGAGRSILIDKNGNVVAGNKTLESAAAIGMDDVIVVESDGTKLIAVKRTDLDINSKQGREMALADNKVSEVNLKFDEYVLNNLAADFEIDLTDWGFKVTAIAKNVQQNEGGLTKRFIVPPFSILDSRQGYWQERKKQWRERIGDNGESRNNTLRQSASGDDPGYYRQKSGVEQQLGRKLTNEEFQRDHYVRKTSIPAGVSLLDPVLSEIIVQWFGLQGGAAFDPFAGDTVFGFVAACSGMSFTGTELLEEQINLNQERVDAEGLSAVYLCDDGRNIASHLEAESQDLLFSCPPYFDLEVYSEKENDASNQQTYAGFYQILDTAFRNAVTCLKENRFAVVVVGDVRSEKTGAYYGFPQDVIQTFRSAGLHYYNDMVLVEQAGNAAIRAAGQMKHRKPVKTHQQVLVFYKGDPRQIKNHFPEIIYEPEDLESFGLDSADESGDVKE